MGSATVPRRGAGSKVHRGGPGRIKGPARWQGSAGRLTRDEVARVLAHLTGPERIVASLLYGAGLRLLEACRLRIKDVDFNRRELFIRDGKGRKDRVTILPD